MSKNLPYEFDYIQEAAAKYGNIRFESEIERFLQKCTAEDRDLISCVAKTTKSNQSFDRIMHWVGNDWENDSIEADVYFLFHLMDVLDMDFE